MKGFYIFLVILLTLSSWLNFAAAQDNKEIPPVYEPIHSYLATPAAGHIHEIPVVIMRFLPTSDGKNLDVSKASNYWELGEISLEELKARIDAFDKRIKFMLEDREPIQRL